MSFLITDADLVQIKVNQTLAGQAIMNSFWYQFVGVSEASQTDSEKFLEAFHAHLIPSWVSDVSSDVNFGLIQVQLFDGTDFPTDVMDVNLNGALSVPSSPPFVTVSIQFKTGSRVVKTGGKRISGIPTSHITNGVLGGTVQGQWITNANLMGSVFDVENDLSDVVGIGRPIVVSSKNWVNGVPTVWRNVSTTVVNPNAGSQNSRKLGYGQ